MFLVYRHCDSVGRVGELGEVGIGDVLVDDVLEEGICEGVFVGGFEAGEEAEEGVDGEGFGDMDNPLTL